MKSMKLLARGALLLLMPLYILALAGCGGRSRAMQRMDAAEELMPLRPDSSLAILDSIPSESLSGPAEAARYALLKSIAMDKNYIDTTTFDIIQPAVDYYLSHGSADEKLRTSYYQALIYLHRGDLSMTMQTLLKAEAMGRNATDSLTLALLYAARGAVNSMSYHMEDFVSDNLKAAKILHLIDDPDRELQCLLKVLNGAMVLDDKNMADSVLAVATGLAERTGAYKDRVEGLRLQYSLVLCDTATARKALASVTDISGLSIDSQLDLCYGYMRLNEPRKALEVIGMVGRITNPSDSLRYTLLRAQALEANGELREALEAYRTVDDLTDIIIKQTCSSKSEVAEEQYRIEIENMREIRNRERLIWLSLSALILLILVSAIIFYKMRYAKADRRRLMLEKERMSHQMSQLEEEKNRLTGLIEQKGLSRPLVDVVKQRLSMLNHLLAAHITGNTAHAKPYDKWLRENTENSDRFIRSIRETIAATNPKFLPRLAEKGLSETEIDYVCLAVLGLRSGEIGSYLNIKSHYRMSHNIRMKFGLPENSSNLGPYIRGLMEK